MKLYQAGYYRLGRRGSGSGWNIVAPSVGMSEFAKAGFKGIAARLADLKQTVQAPPEAMGIFQHDRFVYLMHVNYAASGEDSRGGFWLPPEGTAPARGRVAPKFPRGLDTAAPFSV